MDSWEWDSGARDMSPVPKLTTQKAVNVPERYLDDHVKVSA